MKKSSYYVSETTKDKKDDNIVIVEVQINNEPIYKIRCTLGELKKMSLDQIRLKLDLPENISKYFYFRTPRIREEIDIENESKYFATELYFQAKKFSTRTGKLYTANFINVYVYPYPIAPTYLSKDEYREQFIEHY